MPVQEAASVPSSIYDVVGPVCETADFVAKQRELALEAGDLLASAMQCLQKQVPPSSMSLSLKRYWHVWI